MEWLKEASQRYTSTSSPPCPSQPVFVIGKGASIGRGEFGIVRWDPLTGEESHIGRFPYRPFAMLATLEDKLFLIGGDFSGQPTKTVHSFCPGDAGRRDHFATLLLLLFEHSGFNLTRFAFSIP